MKDRKEDREKEIEVSQMLAERGRLADQFLKDKFWVKYLEPELAKIQNEALGAKNWSPASGIKTVDEVALTSAYYSAIDQAVGNILTKIKQFIQVGAEAEAWLKKLPEEK